jgi:hypothetical protein
MPVKADIVILRKIIVGEVTGAAAEKHPGARRVSVAGHCRANAARSEHLTYLVAGRRISSRRIAQTTVSISGEFAKAS